MEFNLKKILWSVLLSSGEPVNPKKFQDFVHRSFSDRFLSLNELRVAVAELNAQAADEQSPQEIAEGPDGYYIRLKPEFAELVRTYKGEPKPQKMTAASMETLSVIAYRQPITRGQIEAIRGVSCDGPVGKLLELELIEGRQNETLPGRPVEFTTTNKFLSICGIKSLGELPQTEVAEDDRLREFFKKSEVLTQTPLPEVAQEASVAALTEETQNA